MDIKHIKLKHGLGLRLKFGLKPRLNLKKQIFLLTIGLLLPFMTMAQRPTRADSIASALMDMMELYPVSTLLDVYKSSFQNRFGPGHIVADTLKAKQYLDWELSQEFHYPNPDYEPTIYDGNFVRVNLALIKDGRLDYNTFFNAFLESATTTAMPSIEEFIPQWYQILEVVYRKYPNLPDIERDRRDIQSRLEQGIYQGEHSDVYHQRYDPHYRIIRRDVFENRLKPIIDATATRSGT